MAYDTYMHTFYGKKPNGKLNDILVENDKSKVQVGEAKESDGNYPFSQVAKQFYVGKKTLLMAETAS